MLDNLNFLVTIDPTLPLVLDQAILAFGPFEAKHEGALVYSQEAHEALSCFYVDLLCGRPIPLHFAAREVQEVSTIVALALFLDRQVVLSPKMPGLLASVNLWETLGEVGLAHIDRDLARLFLLLKAYLAEKTSRQQAGQKLANVVGWVRDWLLEDRLPALPKEPPPPQILDRGTNGFVVALTTPTFLVHGMIELYRQGHLRGVLYAPSQDKTHVLAFRKPCLHFDLAKARSQLNAAEGGWELQRYCLRSPAKGSLLPRDTLTEVFVRV